MSMNTPLLAVPVIFSRLTALNRLSFLVSGCPITKEIIEILDDQAGQVADELEAYRQPDEFKDVSLVIENSDEEHPTLIVHVDREDAEFLADRIDEFLREHGNRTERERHSATDVLVSNGRLTPSLQFLTDCKHPLRSRIFTSHQRDHYRFNSGGQSAKTDTLEER